MRNTVVKTFRGNGTWTAPGGVTRVKATTFGILRTPIAGMQHAMMTVDRRMAAYGWGINTSGQLGVGDVTPRSSPVAVLGGVQFRQVSGYGQTTYGVAYGGVGYAWGANTSGQIADGTVISKSSPVAMVGGFTFREIHAGGGHAVGLNHLGNAYGWGLNGSGQVGDGTGGAGIARSSPIAVIGGFSYRALTTCASSSLGLDQSGAAYGWGLNQNGELANGDVLPRSSPVAVVGGLSFRTIVGGATHVLALTADGTCYAWGSNINGQLGDGTVIGRSSPVAILGGLKFRQVSAGDSTSIGITQDGTAYAWGFNAQGGLGVGDVLPRSSPVAVLGGLKFTLIGVNNLSGSYGLTPTGAMYAWGNNVNGELGLGDVISRSSPIAVLGGLTFNTITDFWLGNVYIDVVPGTTYTITLFAVTPTFGIIPLWDDPSLTGGQTLRLVLEYAI